MSALWKRQSLCVLCNSISAYCNSGTTIFCAGSGIFFANMREYPSVAKPDTNSENEKEQARVSDAAIEIEFSHLAVKTASLGFCGCPGAC